MILWFTHIVQSSLKSTNDSSKFVKTNEQEPWTETFSSPTIVKQVKLFWILEYPTSVNLY